MHFSLIVHKIYCTFSLYIFTLLICSIAEEDNAQQPPDEPLDHEREEDDGEIIEGEEEEVAEEEHEKEPQEPEVQYDEETQVLIDEATSARERYQEAEKAVNELQSEIRQLEEKLERDYGPDEEFASLEDRKSVV